MSLTAAQIQDIVVTERIASVLSLTASTFVFVTFLFSDKFRKPINRLVFYATFGNVLVNIATLISTDGIEAGEGSSLCQFQAVLIQWSVPTQTLCFVSRKPANILIKYIAERQRPLTVTQVDAS